MKKLPFLSASGFWLIIMILFFASCNGNKSSEANSENVDATIKTPEPGDSKAGILTGSLDTLWIDAPTFLALGKPPMPKNWTIFRFYIDNSNVLTLAGWSANNSNGQFHPSGGTPPSPNLLLLKGNPSTITYAAGDYLGNLILRPAQLNKIQSLINSNNSNSVLFAPLIDNHQITYKIFLSAAKSKNDVSFNLVPTDEDLNPSPPRNSN